MELSYQEDSSKSSSDEIDHRSSSELQNDHEMGTGRSYECVFCKRGFTTAQALGGHMNIHRKDRANNNKNNKGSTTSTKVDADLGFYSSTNLARGVYYNSSAPNDHHREVDSLNYHQIYYNHPSHEVLCVENYQREVDHGHEFLFGQEWRQRGLSLYTTNLPLTKDKIEINKNSSEVDELDLELRLGHYP